MNKKLKNEKKEQKEECQKCAELLKKCNEMEEGWKRSVADFANFKKRSEEEKNLIMNVAKAEVVLSFLPMYDSLQRALETDLENKEGINKVIQMFESIMNSYQIEKIVTGKDFDPKWCEAIGFVDGNKENDGQVAQVVENGFKTGESVIKPAKVLLFKQK